jgi:hypothetical protein
MAAGSTYTPIFTTTLGSAAASVTFSSIPSTYTDLVLVSFAQGQASGGDNRLQLQFNGDTATNYSSTYLVGNGSTASSARDTNRSQIDNVTQLADSGSSSFSPFIHHIMNYANTTTYKTVLQRGNDAGDTTTSYRQTGASAGLWRSTSAITSIVIKGGGGNSSSGFSAGSTFTLYGIAAA